jgi:outer membrane protein assembly factor BamB
MPRLTSIGLASLLALSVLAADKGDWTQWRGPDRDGTSRETGLLDRWPEDGPKLAWKADGLGRGFSSVSIADGRLFTLGRLKKGGTHLVALDLSTHKVLWTAPVGGGDPNSTPTVDDDRVYALGRDGDLVCADTATGKVVWKKNFRKDFGGSMMSGWGYSESVLVDGDKLVCTPGAHKAMIVALDKKTGKPLWESTVPDKLGNRGKDGAGYSSVVVSNACGVKQYVQLTGRGVISVAADDGKFLWSYNKVANGTANIPTPIVKGDYVFASSGYGTGAALLKVEKQGDGLTAKEEYFLPAKTMQNHHGGMILVGGYVYCGHGHNEGFPLCVELKTGKVMWRPGRGAGQGSAAVVYADGNLYFRYQNGTMALVEATPKEYRLKGSFKLATVNGESWPHPVIAGGKLYVRDQDTLLCYDIKK